MALGREKRGGEDLELRLRWGAWMGEKGEAEIMVEGRPSLFWWVWALVNYGGGWKRTEKVGHG